MRWYINDLSLQGQYSSESAFVAEISQMLSLRRRLPSIASGLFCSREHLRNRPAVANISVISILRSAPQRDFRNVTLSWLDKSGPFIEDDRQDARHDLFFYDEIDVTEHGLGEAARQQLAARDAASFSFPGGVVDFCQDPINVRQGFADEPIANVDILNIWSFDKLEEHARSCESLPATWAAFLTYCIGRFDRLRFSASIADVLRSETFSRVAAEAAIDLLGVLQKLAAERDAQGKLSINGERIREAYFVGGAWFSDESVSNKLAFEREMTFPDPEDSSREIFAPWHGKIQTPQYRIHFQYPIPAGQRVVKVLYVGPKISKR